MDASVIESMGGVIYGVEPDMFYWAPSVDKKGKEFLKIFRDPVTNKITLIYDNDSNKFKKNKQVRNNKNRYYINNLLSQ